MGRSWPAAGQLLAEAAKGLEIATAEWLYWFNHRRSFEYCDDLTPAEAEQAHYAY